MEVVNNAGEGGSFNQWMLEVCAGLQATNPIITKNDTLEVPPSGSRLIYANRLIATDQDNLPSELQFTIVANTAHGNVKLNGQTLGVGDHFTMLDVYASAVEYTNTNPAALYDYFTFSVNDGEGGYTGTPRFNIKMDAGAEPSGANSPVELEEVYLFPNPATDEVNIVFGTNAGVPVAVTLMDVQGQQMAANLTGLGTSTVKINTSSLVPGLYFVQVKTKAGTFVRKLVIE